LILIIIIMRLRRLLIYVEIQDIIIGAR